MPENIENKLLCPFEKTYPSQLNKNDTFYMSLAYNAAIDAYKKGEVPVGAIIVKNGEIIGCSFNEVEFTQDPTAHAEILAITQAANHQQDWRLNDCTLYVTKEPCPMCAGALVMARVKRVVFAVPDPKMGFLGGAINILKTQTLNHHYEIEAGIMETECRNLLKTFFDTKRANKN